MTKSLIFTSLDQIIEDPKKTKEVLRWLLSKGFLNEIEVAIWEADQEIEKHLPEAQDYGATDYM